MVGYTPSSALLRTLHGKPEPWFERLALRVNAAMTRYAMSAPGEGILVGLSGGKDSLALLVLLAARLKTARTQSSSCPSDDPGGPRLRACYIENPMNPMPDSALTAVRTLCEAAFVPFSVRTAPIDTSKGCYFCAHARRKALAEEALSNGVRVIALGHTRNDVAQTAILNLAQHGTLEGLAPVRGYFNEKFTVIRPLVFCDESDVRRACARLALPIQPSPCPIAGTTKRAEAAAALDAMRRVHPEALANIARAAHEILALQETKNYLDDHASLRDL